MKVVVLGQLCSISETVDSLRVGRRVMCNFVWSQMIYLWLCNESLNYAKDTNTCTQTKTINLFVCDTVFRCVYTNLKIGFSDFAYIIPRIIRF